MGKLLLVLVTIHDRPGATSVDGIPRALPSKLGRRRYTSLFPIPKGYIVV